MTNEPSQRGEPTVAAVVVTRNGARWLPDLITSLSRLRRAPHYWHAVDIASTDGSADILRSAFADHVSFMASGTGFGSAVAAAVAQLPDTEWLWLLHDDMSVTESALANLLDEAADEDIAVVGPKIREWPSLRRLVEVGLAISGTAHRETGLETGEPDDGQHDRPCDVLAVGSAGMLVRRSVWDELGGLDENLPLFFDDIDFGWRANHAGYRVRVAPQAVCFHAEASARGTRQVGAGDVSGGEHRRAGIYTALANATPAMFWWQYVRLLCGSMLRFLGLVVVKDLPAARQELWAVARVYGSPRQLARARRARARPADKRRVRGLMPPPWLVYVRGFETLVVAARAVARPETVVSAGRRSAVPDALPVRDDRPWWSRHPWLASVLVLVVMSLVAARGLLGSGPLHGGALLASPASTGHWWSLFFAGWHDVGAGSAVAGPPYVLLLAVAATPLWFIPGTLISALVVFAVPISALTAHRFARRLSMHRGVRIAWAVTYAAAVVASGALSQGRLGTIVALIVLPVVAGAVWQMFAAPSWQAGIRVGLWTAIAGAFAPVVYPMTVVVLVGCAVWQRRAARWGQIALAVVIPWPLLAGWLVERAMHPPRVWQEAGFAAAGHADVLDVLFGRGGGIGAAPGWMSAGLIVLALVSLVPSRTRRAVTVSWVLGIVGLATAAWAMTATYTPASSTVARTAWIAVPAVVWLAGLAAACAFAAGDMIRDEGIRVRPLMAMAVLAAVLPGCTAVWWIVRGIEDPLTRSEPDVVPAYVAAQSGRTLVLSGGIDDGLNIDVVRGAGPVIGDEAVQADVAQLDASARAVADIMTDADPGAVKVLADHGITSVYAPYAEPLVARRLDAMPDLTPAGSDRSGSRVWRTELEVSEPREQSRPWNFVIAAGQTVAWLIVIVLAVPGRNATGEAVRDHE